mgnify:CR=1 FL=1
MLLVIIQHSVQQQHIGVNRGLNQMLNGKVAEVLIFNEALDSTNQTNVFNYLNDKWAIV